MPIFCILNYASEEKIVSSSDTAYTVSTNLSASCTRHVTPALRHSKRLAWNFPTGFPPSVAGAGVPDAGYPGTRNIGASGPSYPLTSVIRLQLGNFRRFNQRLVSKKRANKTYLFKLNYFSW